MQFGCFVFKRSNITRAITRTIEVVVVDRGAILPTLALWPLPIAVHLDLVLCALPLLSSQESQLVILQLDLVAEQDETHFLFFSFFFFVVVFETVSHYVV